jgi:N-acetylneuraminate synthase
MPFMPVLRHRSIQLGSRRIADGEPPYLIAEIGINHNGSLEIAKQLIRGAAQAGCDCVKFQKRTPELCVPPEQRAVERETPWGRLTYLDYRRRVEFGTAEYDEIDRYCREQGIAWTASCWDEPSVAFLTRYDVPFLKGASASITDHALLRVMRQSGIPLMLSTGMSTLAEIRAAVRSVGTQQLLLAHSTSAYPCPVNELNLRMITTLRKLFPGVPVGYSGHETGIAPSSTAVTLGALFVERHVTLDRTMWGSDQSASLDLPRLRRLVRRIRKLEQTLGTGVKQVYESEQTSLKRLRRAPSPPAPPPLRLIAFR